MLLIDSGNSYTKFASLSLIGGEWQFDNFNRCKNNEVNEEWLDKHYSGMSKVIFASVSGADIRIVLNHWCNVNNTLFKVVETEKSNFGVSVVYKEEARFGVDRWLALLGAKKLYPNHACLVVDIGTATTIDLVAHNGEHQGGWIIPGIDLLHDCLNIGTKNISTQSETLSDIEPGLNTSECVNNGTWLVTIASIEKAYNSQRKHFSELKLIVTGGNAKKLLSLLPPKTEYNKGLVFLGLASYA